jgi:hypothetical protein
MLLQICIQLPHKHPRPMGHYGSQTCAEIEGLAAAAIVAAVSAEREACAKVAAVFAATDVIGRSVQDQKAGQITAGEIAQAIRDRSSKEGV